MNLSAESEPVEVQLDVGTDVVVGFAQGPEQNLLTSLLTSCLELIREGKRVEIEWELCGSGDREHRTQALPAGKYTLRLPSSDELASKSKVLRRRKCPLSLGGKGVHHFLLDRKPTGIGIVFPESTVGRDRPQVRRT